MLTEYITKKLLDTASTVATDFLKRRLADFDQRATARKDSVDTRKAASLLLEGHQISSGTLTVSPETIRQSLVNHLQTVRTWSSTIAFADLRGSKGLADIFQDLEMYVTPTRLHMAAVEREDTIPLMSIFNQWKTTKDPAGNDHPILADIAGVLPGAHSELSAHDAADRADAHSAEGEAPAKHYLILGQPGAGKTTSMQKLCSLFFEQGIPNFSFPLFIRFRDLENQDTTKHALTAHLMKILPITFNFHGSIETSGTDREHLQLSTFRRFLDLLQPLIVLDGFDEYPDEKGKEALAKEIQTLATELGGARLVITCRTGEFMHHLDNTKILEIAPLQPSQIKDFVKKWLSNPASAEEFLDALGKSPYGGAAMKPLLLAHLCAIYERIGQIPDRPKTIYRKIVSLLLEDWDQQRFVRRRSRYSRFETDRKFEFLSFLGFDLTTRTHKSVFERNDFMLSYQKRALDFGLDRSEADAVVDEIESHTGLFVETGFEKYEFFHKSIQEYLTAEYIVKLPSIPQGPRFLSELGAELAIAVAISSAAGVYLSDLVHRILSKAKLSKTFYAALINRLWIERPDFDRGDQTIISMIALLTLWITEGETLTTGRLSEFTGYEQEEMYNQWVDLFDRRRVLAVVDKYFRPAPSSGRSIAEIDGRFAAVKAIAGLPGVVVPRYAAVPLGIVVGMA
jgi:hypothetical protein